MGIAQLNKFVQNRNYLTKYELYDQTLLFDGSNLLHTLFQMSNDSNNKFNGDYSYLMEVINHFFDSLETINVKPIIILDGSINKDKYKLPVKIKQYKKKIDIVINLFDNNFDAKLLPLLLMNLFELIMIQRNIAFLRCTYEADQTLFLLSRDLQLPIVTDDGDFLIENLSSGIISTKILLENIEKIQNESNYNYINCLIYKIDHLVKDYSIQNVDLIRISSIFLGQEHGEKEYVKELISRLSYWSDESSRRNFIIDQVFQFLSIQSDVDELLQSIENLVFQEDYHILKDLILNTFSLFNESNDIDVHSTLKNKSYIDYIKKKYKNQFYGNPNIPKWLNEKFINGMISKRFLSIINVHLDLHPLLIENIKLKHSIEYCSSKLTLYIYHLLSNGNNIKVIDKYYRYENDIRKQSIHLNESIDKNIPTLEDIEQMNETLRLKLLFNILEIDQIIVEQFNYELNRIEADNNGIINKEASYNILLMLIILIYMSKQLNGNLPIESFLSLFLSILFNGHSSKNIPTLIQFDRIFLNIDDDCVVEHLNKKLLTMEDNVHLPLSPAKVMHYFAIYQVLFQNIISLIALLRLENCFLFPRIPFLLNGSFIYYLSTKLAQSEDPLFYFENNFVGTIETTIRPVILNLMKLIIKHSIFKSLTLNTKMKNQDEEELINNLANITINNSANYCRLDQIVL